MGVDWVETCPFKAVFIGVSCLREPPLTFGLCSGAVPSDQVVSLAEEQLPLDCDSSYTMTNDSQIHHE